MQPFDENGYANEWLFHAEDGQLQFCDQVHHSFAALFDSRLPSCIRQVFQNPVDRKLGEIQGFEPMKTFRQQISFQFPAKEQLSLLVKCSKNSQIPVIS